MHSYQIGYTAIEGRSLCVETSETEFDIDVDNQPFENAFYDMWNLIHDHCKENHLHNFRIDYINEVPYYEY